MDNTTSSSDVWNNVTSSSHDDALLLYQPGIRDVIRKMMYITIGTVGIVDNSFVVGVFAFFVNITDKVYTNYAE